ncbi:MAG: pyridoxal-phosphate dependent enzyme [Ginsengibacter sp.]
MYDTLNIYPRINLLNDDLFGLKKIKLSILRLDEIHPVVSGNKLFKLHYFLDEAIASEHKTIITFGGAYSNHLAATAFACEKKGLQSIAVVRGEEPAMLSHTLLFCRQYGMKFKFISRALYKNIDTYEFLSMLNAEYGRHTLVPEGGFSMQGAKGAEIIADFYERKKYTHICCATGTATTFAGLIQGSGNTSAIVGFSVLKNMTDFPGKLKKLQVDESKNYSINGNYHFGGYAKKTSELIIFMNNFYENNKIPLDFVYTGKMMFGVYDLINKNYFLPGSNILCIHTGGLQGNKSLAKGILNF